MSGTARQAPSSQGSVPLPVGVGCPGLAGHSREDPPPPDPRLASPAHATPEPWQSFHTDCDEADAVGREVPPALTTSGCDPGSSTASWLVRSGGEQSSEPASPDAAITVC